jgi:hypothetical protein
VIIGTRPEIADETMRECAELGIKNVWMHRGHGATSTRSSIPANTSTEQLNEFGAQGWQVVGVTTKKQLLIAPAQAIVLMRELRQTSEGPVTASLVHARV